MRFWSWRSCKDPKRVLTTVGFQALQFDTAKKQFVATRKVPVADDHDLEDLTFSRSTDSVKAVIQLAVEATGQQLVVHLGHQIEPVRGIGIQTLAQRGTRRNIGQTQGTNEEGVGANVFDGIKVVLAQAQQAKIGLEYVAVGNARAHWKSRINQRVDLDGFEILSNKCQTSVSTKVVGQLFDNEIGHVRAHLQGEPHLKPKPLIYKDYSDFSTMKSRIQGHVKPHAQYAYKGYHGALSQALPDELRARLFQS